MTTQDSSDVNDCLKTRYWFYFLASSLIVFFAGVIVILIWRIVEHLVPGCGWMSVVTGSESRNPPVERSRFSASRTANIAARIKWKCEKLVSAQTLIGRFVVSVNWAFVSCTIFI